MSAAFPRPASDNGYNSAQEGMSLRAWLAGQALAGLCVWRACKTVEEQKVCAAQSVSMADAVIAELCKSKSLDEPKPNE